MGGDGDAWAVKKRAARMGWGTVTHTRMRQRGVRMGGGRDCDGDAPHISPRRACLPAAAEGPVAGRAAGPG